MGELADFGPTEDEPEIVWRDSAGNGLTQDEVDDLAYQFRYYHAEREIERTENYWKFLRWCVDHGSDIIGEPDGTAVLRPQKVMKPLPHIEWHLFIDAQLELPEAPQNDLPPAA